MLTIGAFSKLTGVSARMLRYYDALGLLRPDHVGADNGYRYYGEGQTQDLARIERLKRYGFPLGEIGPLLALPEAELAQRVHRRRLEAYAQLNELRQSLRRMEQDIIQLEGIEMLNESYHVIVLEDPAQRVFSLRRTINVAETHALFQDLRREMAARGLKQAGCTQQLYHGGEFSYDEMDVEAQVVVEGEDPAVTVRPAQTCAAVVHTGPYEELKYAYDALCAWLAQHTEYRVCGPAIERYLKDEGMVGSPEELETGVLFPVTKEA